MARPRRLHRLRIQRDPETLHSFRSIVRALGLFIALISIVVVYSWLWQLSVNKHADSNKVATQRVFNDPKDLSVELIADLDAILVLGGGVPESIDSPPVYVRRRCDDASIVVQRYSQIAAGAGRLGSRKKNKKLEGTAGLPIVCLSAGTAHIAQLVGSDGLPVWESTACAAYLSNKHKITTNVYVETTSYDTIGNAFFTRTLFTDINNWKKLLIVTNEFHMERTIKIFDWIFLEVDGNHGSRKNQEQPYQLYYLASPDVGLAPHAVEARREKEAQSSKMVSEVLAPQYKTLQQIQWFLTNDHSMYTSNKLIERGRGIKHGDAAHASDMVKLSYGGGRVDK